MKKRLIVCGFFLLIFYSFSFGQNARDNGLVGTFQGEEYSNQTLGFSFKTPSKWFLPTKDELAMYLGDPERTSEKIEFVITKKKIDAQENSLLGYSVLKQPSSAVTAKVVAGATKDQFLKDPDIRLTRDISSERLGNREFITFEMGFLSFPKQRVRTYMTMSGTYLITFALTYWDEESLKVMTDSLNTIKFQPK